MRRHLGCIIKFCGDRQFPTNDNSRLSHYRLMLSPTAQVLNITETTDRNIFSHSCNSINVPSINHYQYSHLCYLVFTTGKQSRFIPCTRTLYIVQERFIQISIISNLSILLQETQYDARSMMPGWIANMLFVELFSQKLQRYRKFVVWYVFLLKSLQVCDRDIEPMLDRI